jgi:tripartite-type tricarboxylate transporter receptor subunit TctC
VEQEIQNHQHDDRHTHNAADVRERFAALGVDPVGNTPEEFAAVLKRDRVRWGELVRRQNLKFD